MIYDGYLPIIVGYPRSGNHWITALLETYFNKRRLNQSEFCFCDKDSDEYLYYGSHDLKCKEKFKHENILYLYRLPVDVLFSYAYAEDSQSDTKFLEKKLKQIADHYKKYLLGKIQYFVRYENLQSDFISEFKIFTDFFGEELDVGKANEINEKNSKDYVIQFIIKSSSSGVGSKYINENLLSNSYSIERNNFRRKYHKVIFDYLLIEFGEKLFDFFKEEEFSCL